jgi:hypothetical protein
MISGMSSPADIGDSSDAFNTTVLPKASGLTTVRQASTWAPFHGEIPATTPSGRVDGAGGIRTGACRTSRSCSGTTGTVNVCEAQLLVGTTFSPDIPQGRISSRVVTVLLPEGAVWVFIAHHLVFPGTRVLASQAMGEDGFHEPRFARISPQAPRIG